MQSSFTFKWIALPDWSNKMQIFLSICNEGIQQYRIVKLLKMLLPMCGCLNQINVANLIWPLSSDSIFVSALSTFLFAFQNVLSLPIFLLYLVSINEFKCIMIDKSTQLQHLPIRGWYKSLQGSAISGSTKLTHSLTRSRSGNRIHQPLTLY